jgi:hypothetical protein
MCKPTDECLPLRVGMKIKRDDAMRYTILECEGDRAYRVETIQWSGASSVNYYAEGWRFCNRHHEEDKA